MKIVDMHTHLGFTDKNEDILSRLDEAGIYGCCAFSSPPKETGKKNGKSFDERLSEVLRFTSAAPERLFPVLWIHPYEENIIEKIDTAVENGIAAFKMICSNYNVDDDKSLKLLEYIAYTGKPVIFHTGILWDGQNTSNRNRPANWEALINIKGLRFSIGHCSWPWTDECIAVYGKFLNARLGGDTAEMFLDITPGTPQIYREELLTKLFTVGYNVGSNIIFGTDCNAEAYNSEWASAWLGTDRKIFDKLGVSRQIRENIYYNNVMRFLGKTTETIHVISPDTDSADNWSPVNEDVKGIIEKYYKMLNFGSEYDNEFYEALNNTKISDAISIARYDFNEKDGKRNLLSYLYFCKAAEEKYTEKNIGSDIFFDTMSDLKIWTDIWSDVKGELYLGESAWLAHHMNLHLFKLGRLEFCMGQAEHGVPDKDIAKGDNVIEIHIPSDGKPLKYDECVKSIETAKQFFAEYFPEFTYEHFTCHSWLLDTSLGEILSTNSNILRFQSLFDIVFEEESDDIIGYTFKWKMKKYQIKNAHPTTAFAAKVKERIVGGGKFYVGLGII